MVKPNSPNSGFVLPVFKIFRLQKLAVRIEVRQHGVQGRVSQLFIGDSISIDIILPDHLNGPREPGDGGIVDSVIVRCGTRSQDLETDHQIQNNAYDQKAADYLPLHSSATVAQVRICASGREIRR